MKTAITAAKDRKRTYLPTIKKYIVANCKVDVEKPGPNIRLGIVHAVQNDVLVRVGNKGNGASGSFKLSEKVAEHMPKAVKKPKAPTVRKAETPKRPKLTKKPAQPEAKTQSKPKAVKAK
ncbi:unnamed protein product [Echinostoma caproni]|uniref:H15 domain-containing protein n=1 Tax=Echinostoma caproni TaxID=27848 RepID=A0A183ALJ4_9TREM|nr:unnamed protein product [Echinostoma caproni]